MAECISTIPRPGGLRLCVHGFGTEQRGDLVPIVLVLSNGILGKHSENTCPLHMSLNRRSFDIDYALCKVDGEGNITMRLCATAM